MAMHQTVKLQQTIRLAAMNLLARREYSYKELQQKLSQRFADSSTVDAVLKQLADEDLQSDQRFAENYCRALVNKGKGPLYIQQKMQQKGLAEAVISDALLCYDDQWLQLARQVYHKKYVTACRNAAEKAKRYRFMSSRGFLTEHITELFHSD